MTLLSHYTDRAGLEGIAKSQAFRATNFMDLDDTSEFFYAWKHLQSDALETAIGSIPKDLRRQGPDIDRAINDAAMQLKGSLRNTAGYSQLYVTSFACGTTPDHDRREMLTLWRIYTQSRGYCLQFDYAHVRRMLDLEIQSSSFEVAGLAAVTYGVNNDERTHRELAFQIAQQILLQVLRTRLDIRVDLPTERMWAESTLARRVM